MASNLFGQRKEMQPETYKERDPTFELVLMQAITRCNWDDWKAQKGWLKSDLKRGDDISAVESLLKLAYDIISYDKNLLEETQITDLETNFYGEKNKDDGYPIKLVLSALKRNPYQDLEQDQTSYDIAGFYDGNKLITKPSFQEYSKFHNKAVNDLFGFEKPFNKLLATITKLMNNRYVKFISSIEKICKQVAAAFDFKGYSDALKITKKMEMTPDEKELITQKRAKRKGFDWSPPEVEPGKASMPLLTNNPFQAASVFASMGINVSELDKRFLHLEVLPGFLRLGFRFIHGEGEDKQWWSIKISDDENDKERNIEALYKLTTYRNVLNYIIPRCDVLEESIALIECKVSVESTLREITSKLFALTSYILGFQPIEKKGFDFSNVGSPAIK